MGVPSATLTSSASPKRVKDVKPKIIGAGQKNDIRAFFKASAPKESTPLVAKKEEAL